MTEEFQRLGIFGDWAHPYLTMNFKYQAAIARAFGRFVERGLVYKGKKPVHWCIHCRTALAEAEVEYEDHTSPSIYVEFPLADDEPRRAGRRVPALAARDVMPHLDDDALDDPVEPGGRVSPGVRLRRLLDDGGRGADARRNWPGAWAPRRARPSASRSRASRASDLERFNFRHPLYDRDSLAVLADYVTLEQGTGIVHTAPGHGADDFNTGKNTGSRSTRPSARTAASSTTWTVRRRAGVRGEPASRRSAHRARAALALRPVPAHVSALLAVPQPGDLPGDVAVVHPDGRRPRRHAGWTLAADAARGSAPRDR